MHCLKWKHLTTNIECRSKLLKVTVVTCCDLFSLEMESYMLNVTANLMQQQCSTSPVFHMRICSHTYVDNHTKLNIFIVQCGRTLHLINRFWQTIIHSPAQSVKTVNRVFFLCASEVWGKITPMMSPWCHEFIIFMTESLFLIVAVESVKTEEAQWEIISGCIVGNDGAELALDYTKPCSGALIWSLCLLELQTLWWNNYWVVEKNKVTRPLFLLVCLCHPLISCGETAAGDVRRE